MTRLKKLKEELNSANKEEEVKVEKTEKPKKEKKAKAVVKWSNLFKDSLILILNVEHEEGGINQIWSLRLEGSFNFFSILLRICWFFTFYVCYISFIFFSILFLYLCYLFSRERSTLLFPFFGEGFEAGRTSCR